MKEAQISYELSLIGTNVRRLRKQRELTLRQLADRAGVGFRTLSNLENGLRGTTMTTLLKLARSMGVTLTQLLETSAT